MPNPAGTKHPVQERIQLGAEPSLDRFLAEDRDRTLVTQARERRTLGLHDRQLALQYAQGFAYTRDRLDKILLVHIGVRTPLFCLDPGRPLRLLDLSMLLATQFLLLGHRAAKIGQLRLAHPVKTGKLVRAVGHLRPAPAHSNRLTDPAES